MIELQPTTASDAKTFLNELYANAQTYLNHNPYASIGEATEFYTKIVGVTFEGRQDTLAGLTSGNHIELRRDTANAYDPNAIGVWYGQLQLGFLKKQIAAQLAPNIDAGRSIYSAQISTLTGGNRRSYGANILVRQLRQKNKKPVAIGNTNVSRNDILTALIGNRDLRPAQHEIINRVEAGKNTLAILGTGQGKSLCFAYPAAAAALNNACKTVVVYPLRALANDQYEALQRRLSPLSLRIYRANGSIEPTERADLMDALESGEWDIICSTPEFIRYHQDKFCDVSRPNFFVVDESHHIFESKHRSAYKDLATTIAQLGNPQVLALTATAGDEVFAEITKRLKIEAWVIDPAVRENLTIIDTRQTVKKFDYISDVLTFSTGKNIIYCNSRAETMKIAERLRSKIKDGAVAFYHAGVPSEERTHIEQLFRDGQVPTIVATSAFGEGIDLPDVRNVFLYHLNFDFTEFNQQSGRAGRDNAPANIHLLFGEKDRCINDFILERSAPTIYTLRSIYAELKKLRNPQTQMIRLAYTEIAEILQMDKVDAKTIKIALNIFTDCQLVDVGQDDDGHFIFIRPDPPKIDLRQNERYAEGEAERDAFNRFCSIVLTSAPNILQNIINRPIYPSNVPHLR